MAERSSVLRSCDSLVKLQCHRHSRKHIGQRFFFNTHEIPKALPSDASVAERRRVLLKLWELCCLGTLACTLEFFSNIAKWSNALRNL